MKRLFTDYPLVLAALLTLLTACGGGSPSTQTGGEAAEAAPTVDIAVTVGPDVEGSGAELGSAAPDDGSPRAVTFETADGVSLRGTLFGSGQSAIVLSHMYSTEQTSWHPFAQKAADQGYLALTYDFRGYGESGGSKDIDRIDQDVRAAYDFVTTQGAQRVVLIGADMGGTASMKVAAGLGGDLAGLVVLSAPQAFKGLEVTQSELGALSMPSLWLSARTDMVTPTLEDMHDAAAGPDKLIWVFEGSGAHGTFIFDSPLDAEDLETRLLDFLNRVAPPTG